MTIWDIIILQSCAYINNVGHNKVSGPHSNTYPDQRHVFEWHVLGCAYKDIKKKMYLAEMFDGKTCLIC